MHDAGARTALAKHGAEQPTVVLLMVWSNLDEVHAERLVAWSRPDQHAGVPPAAERGLQASGQRAAIGKQQPGPLLTQRRRRQRRQRWLRRLRPPGNPILASHQRISLSGDGDFQSP